MTPAETPLALKRRARRMHRALADTHPDAHCELDFTSPLELAVATILSAQCTDKRVNEVTPKVFSRYPSAADYAAADRTELEEMIKPTGFFRNKTESLIKLGHALVEKHGGEVPGRLKQLVELPGIGRKTANVILGNAFGVPGITVDTHFSRLVRRFGWTAEDDAVKIEFAVAELIEKRDWTMLSHRVIFHGRRVCHSRRPACGACTLAKSCPSFGLGPTEPSAAVKLLKGPRVAELARAAGLADLVPADAAASVGDAAPVDDAGPGDAGPGDAAVPVDDAVPADPAVPAVAVGARPAASGADASPTGAA